MLKKRLSKNWVKTGIAALLFSCFSVGAFAQNEETYTYYEGYSWNQFYGRNDTLQGNVHEICAASIHAWNKITHITYLEPNYTLTTEGIYQGTYQFANGYLFCDGILKTYVEYANPNLNRTYINDNFDSAIAITKTEERLVEPNPCRTPSGEGCEHIGNHELCSTVPMYSDEYKSNVPDQNKRKIIASVVCANEEEVYVCFFPERIEGWSQYDNEIQDIVRTCILEHENEHKSWIGNSCEENTHIWGAKGSPAYDEHNANMKEAQCYLREIAKCTTDQCRITVSEFYNNALNNARYWDCQKIGNNDSACSGLMND